MWKKQLVHKVLSHPEQRVMGTMECFLQVMDEKVKILDFFIARIGWAKTMHMYQLAGEMTKACTCIVSTYEQSKGVPHES